MERELLDQVIDTDYGQFDLVWSVGAGFDGYWERFFAGQVNGLVAASYPGGVYLNLGRRSGGSPVRIVLLDGPPIDPDPSWEDVVEVSTTVPPGAQACWITWGGGPAGELALPVGAYRVRVSARGRDEAQADECALKALDFYLVQFWPAPAARDEILRVGSADAAYWHHLNGARY